MKVSEYIDRLIGREGGYVDHPSDRGGPTHWGVTEQVARAFGYHGDMRNLTRETAFNIYLRRYWLQPKYDEVNLRSALIAEELLDTGVNMGTGRATQFFQRALNALNMRETRYPDLTVDGNIGNMTLAALDSFLKWRGRDGETVLFRMLDSQQGERYIQIAEMNKSQEDFIFGWFLHRTGPHHAQHSR